MLAAVFQRPLLRPIGADVHRVEHPEVTVIERAAAQGHSVQFHPAGPFFGPFSPDGNALAQEAAGFGAATPAQRHAQRCQQPIQRTRADGQQAFAHIGVQATMIRLVSRQPFGQQRHEAAAAGLKRGEPDGLERGQQRVGMILARATQNQRGSRRWFGLVTQGADGGFAMVTEQLDRLGDELPFVVPSRAAILPPQLDQDFGFGWLAHKVVHLLGNTDFWRSDSFSPLRPPASGNKTFGADSLKGFSRT